MKKKKWKPVRCCGKLYKKWRYYIRHRRKRHAEAVAKSRDSTQRNNYGQTAKEFEKTLYKQHKSCAICGRKARLVALSQDHSHFIAKLEVKVKKMGSLWEAFNKEYKFRYLSRSRKKARRMVVLKLKRESRRGILCFHCNSALRKFLDNYKFLFAAGEYLKKWSCKQGWKFVDDVTKHHNVIKKYSLGGLVWR